MRSLACLCRAAWLTRLRRSYIYRAQDSPRYFLGHAVVIGFVTMTLVLAIFMLWYLGKKNRERAAEIRARGHDWTAEEKESCKYAL